MHVVFKTDVTVERLSSFRVLYQRFHCNETSQCYNTLTKPHLPPCHTYSVWFRSAVLVRGKCSLAPGWATPCCLATQRKCSWMVRQVVCDFESECLHLCGGAAEEKQPPVKKIKSESSVGK